MVLQTDKLIHNIISKQAKIAHVPCDFIVFKKDEVPEDIKSKIAEQYAEEFLEDAQYVLFAKGPIDKDMREKIFKCIDKALGGNKDKKKNANLLTIGDLKLLNVSGSDDDTSEFDDGASSERSEDAEIADQVNDVVGDEDVDLDSSDEDNETTVGNALDNDIDSSEDEDSEDSDEDDEEDEDAEDDSEEDDSDEEDVNVGLGVEESLKRIGKDLLERPVLEDDGDDTLDSTENAEGGEEKPTAPTRYVFLKITLKK